MELDGTREGPHRIGSHYQVFLSDLIQAPKSKLREITVNKCAKVSRDIVPWAKERGVEVEYIAYTETLVGRRVREQH